MLHPPFCPNPFCSNHLTPSGPAWFSRSGSHPTLVVGPVPRFRCSSCGRTFSSRTFDIDFYTKKPVSYLDLLDRHRGSMSLRGMSRAIGRSVGTVQNRLERLARQALALHARLRPLASKHEALSIDGFVSFDLSQFFPSEIAISVTSASRFVLDFSHATRRRSGTMTEKQKAQAALLYPRVQFERGAIGRGFRDLLDSLAAERPPDFLNPLIIITDEKREYVHALTHHPLWKSQDEEHRVIHIRVSSKLPRTYQNPLFPSNYIDREIRKDQANHHRETTCFNRNVAKGMTRLALYLIDHNYRKRFLIKARRGDERVHGEAAGIDRKLIDRGLGAMLREREFLSRIKLPPTLKRVWTQAFDTPLEAHRPVLPAFALGQKGRSHLKAS